LSLSGWVPENLLIPGREVILPAILRPTLFIFVFARASNNRSLLLIMDLLHAAALDFACILAKQRVAPRG
jgi:hypothetical protein